MDERLQASDAVPVAFSPRLRDDERVAELRLQESDEWRRYAAHLGLFPGRRSSAHGGSHPIAA